MKIDETNRELVHTIYAGVLIVSGIVAFFIDLCLLGENGEVGGGTLAYIGEAFTLAGALLGIVQYVNGRISKLEAKV